MFKSRKALWTAAAGLLVLHVTLAWLLRAPEVLTGHDDAQYILLARSLKDFGYHDVFRTDSPIHSMYPPGFPAALAAWSLLAGDRFETFIVLDILSSTAALAVLFAVASRLWPPAIALMSLAVVSVNPFVLDNAGSIASEAPYMLLSVLALCLLQLTDPERKHVVLAGALAIGAALTRSIGVTLILAVGLYWMWERRWTALTAFGLVSASLVGLWLLWTVRAPEQFIGRSYIADGLGSDLNESYWEKTPALGTISTILYRTSDNVPRYLSRHIPSRLITPTVPDTPIDNIFSTTVIAASLIAGLLTAFQRWRSLVIYLVCYGGLLAVWRWPLARFLDPLLPLLVVVVLLGAYTLASRFSPRWGMLAAAAICLVLTVSGGAATAAQLRSRIDCQKGWTPKLGTCMGQIQRGFFASVDYVNKELPADAVLFSGKPATVYYYTGRKTISREAVSRQDESSFMEFLRGSGTRYVLLNQIHFSEEHILPLLEAHCTSFQLEAAFTERSLILRLMEEGDSPQSDACETLADFRRVTGGES